MTGKPLEILICAPLWEQAANILASERIRLDALGWRWIKDESDLDKYARTEQPILCADDSFFDDAPNFLRTISVRLAAGRLRFATGDDLRALIASSIHFGDGMLPRPLKDWPIVKFLAAMALHETGRFSVQDIAAALSVPYSDAGDMILALDKPVRESAALIQRMNDYAEQKRDGQENQKRDCASATSSGTEREAVRDPN